MEAPGEVRVSGPQLATAAGLPEILGERWALMTMADLDSLANYLNFGMTALMFEATGGELRTTAPPQYFGDIISAIAWDAITEGVATAIALWQLEAA